MAYKDFKFSDLKSKFGINQTTDNLFKSATILPIEASDWLKTTLSLSEKMSVSSEKSVSEIIIFPILAETKLRNQDTIELFSGEMLTANRTEGLTGECDFLFTNTPRTLDITAPVICITEAKRNDLNNPRSISQAAAQLVGASVFNKNNNAPKEVIYGACTNGYEWIFLKFENNIITVNTIRYSLTNLPELLGVLQHIINIQIA